MFLLVCQIGLKPIYQLIFDEFCQELLWIVGERLFLGLDNRFVFLQLPLPHLRPITGRIFLIQRLQSKVGITELGSHEQLLLFSDLLVHEIILIDLEPNLALLEELGQLILAVSIKQVFG